MSWYVTLSIGGEASHADLIRLFEGAAEIGILVASNDVHAQTLLDKADTRLRAQDVPDLLLPDATLAFNAPDFREDSFEDLEELCQVLGLPYVRRVDGDDEADGFAVWWMPGMDGTGTASIDGDYEPTLLVSKVRQAIADGTLETLVAESTIPSLPHFTVKP